MIDFILFNMVNYRYVLYQHLEGKQLINSLVAVVRYFGGVKLSATPHT